MSIAIDREGWSGEGDFTETVLAALAGMPDVAALRVEDSPASRAEAGYAFISNEIYVQSATRAEVTATRRFGIVPWRQRIEVPLVALAEIQRFLEGQDEIGPPDYSDEGMIQYLRTHRVVAPYQTRGVKVVEMVRIYAAGRGPRDEAATVASS
ncbi:MAG: hypothetical protein KJ061_09425 [Vicinamibacteraceae bacterium]|nr:hypothetical protein [Vicinamibacteraceae bacterium]